MTRLEETNKRPSILSAFSREYLPDSMSGFRVYDIDWIIQNIKTDCFMLIEEKTNDGKERKGQMSALGLIDALVKEGISSIQNKEKHPLKKIKYLGKHTIIFTGPTLETSDIYFDGVEITEDELKNKLTF